MYIYIEKLILYMINQMLRLQTQTKTPYTTKKKKKKRRRRRHVPWVPWRAETDGFIPVHVVMQDNGLVRKTRRRQIKKLGTWMREKEISKII